MAPEESSTLEQTFQKAYEAASRSCQERYRQCEARIHRSPVSAVLLAAGLGYAASILPLCRIGGTLARLAFALAKPLLIVVGVLKILECLEKKSRDGRLVERLEKEREPLVDSPTGPPQG
jgi:hypothetical protein